MGWNSELSPYDYLVKRAKYYEKRLKIHEKNGMAYYNKPTHIAFRGYEVTKEQYEHVTQLIWAKKRSFEIAAEFLKNNGLGDQWEDHTS